MRFGQTLVFWRSNGKVVCMPDRCPHRGAALSLGRVNKRGDALACPFHGIEFSAAGRCVHIPVEDDARIPDEFRIPSLPVVEADGYIWIWRGPVAEAEMRTPAAVHPDTVGMRYGESTGIWNAHYTRCLENVLDFSHLPFVHRTTIGMFRKNTVTQIDMEDVPGGFRAHLLKAGKRQQSLEFLYPNRWLLMLTRGMMLGLVFAPIDDDRTAVYGRTYYSRHMPGLGRLADAYTRLSQYLVFREDWPIVASQTPGNIRDAVDERLLPSDAPVIAYRKLQRSHEA